jgi:hypothetical protein
MKLEARKHCLALLSTFCLTLGLAGCNPPAEVPTAGDGPKQSATDDNKSGKETKPDNTAKPEESNDDSTDSEGGSNLE